MSDKMLDLIWKLDIEKMNDHLPTERKTLTELLSEEKPQVKSKKNKTHKIKKKDLETICALFPEEEWKNVNLPIVLLRRTEMEKGLYSVSGGVRELYIIHRLSRRTSEKFSRFKLDDHQPYIWKPEAFTAIRKAGSIIIIGYT
ncbi:MAG: DUF61 family protein [Candidatus Heimdallarchaeota archaeon]